jgi:hypothetical protein
VGSNITLISTTPHALRVFDMLIATFINKLVQLVSTTKTNIQLVGIDKHVEEVIIKLVEETKYQHVTTIKVDIETYS